MVEITEKEYNYLKSRDKFLTNLEAAGVDNWDGYSSGYGDTDENDE